MEMDLATLRECFAAGHYRPLTAEDRKAMQYPTLRPYSEIFDFMKEHNCKVEQESFAAMRL
jgi:cephalosporin-C deacetylase-like acetyl esterase